MRYTFRLINNSGFAIDVSSCMLGRLVQLGKPPANMHSNDLAPRYDRASYLHTRTSQHPVYYLLHENFRIRALQSAGPYIIRAIRCSRASCTPFPIVDAADDFFLFRNATTRPYRPNSTITYLELLGICVEREVLVACGERARAPASSVMQINLFRHLRSHSTNAAIDSQVQKKKKNLMMK